MHSRNALRFPTSFRNRFLRFLLDFRGLRTSKIVLPCTREHDFRKIAVFVFGPHFGQMLGDFTSVLDPKSQQKHLRKRFRENIGFPSPFLVVFHDFWTPFGTPFRTPNHLKTLLGPRLGPSRASGVDLEPQDYPRIDS